MLLEQKPNIAKGMKLSTSLKLGVSNIHGKINEE
jgi:hypothetical protein